MESIGSYISMCITTVTYDEANLKYTINFLCLFDKENCVSLLDWCSFLVYLMSLFGFLFRACFMALSTFALLS